MSFLTGEQIRTLTNPRQFRRALKGISLRWARKTLEMVRIDILSKPYGVDDMTKHEKLMGHFQYRNGFFLEVGGHDGYFHSPTYYLEIFSNWTGVLVEPVPSLARRCVKERKHSKVYNYACTRSATSGDVVDFVNCGHSSHVKGSTETEGVSMEEMQVGMRSEDKVISVPATTLSNLLEKYFKELNYEMVEQISHNDYLYRLKERNCFSI